MNIYFTLFLIIYYKIIIKTKIIIIIYKPKEIYIFLQFSIIFSLLILFNHQTHFLNLY